MTATGKRKEREYRNHLLALNELRKILWNGTEGRYSPMAKAVTYALAKLRERGGRGWRPGG